tara:strand:+ start:1905 stop:2057 length:153 start_codon:yes stop_codon:yes gene_type:complete
MKSILTVLTFIIFAGCSTPNKEKEPTQHLLFIQDQLARKPVVVFTEEDFC